LVESYLSDDVYQQADFVANFHAKLFQNTKNTIFIFIIFQTNSILSAMVL